MRPAPRLQRGSSLLELALVLPLLLLLAFGGYDFSRAIRAEMILVNVSREGASLLARNADSPAFAQMVMNALGDTAMPSYGESPGSGGWSSATGFESNAQILITRIRGAANARGGVDATISEQYAWQRGHYTAARSTLWNCPSAFRADGSCAIPSPAPVIALANLGTGDVLGDGDVIYAVEVYFDYQAMFGGLNVGPFLVPTVGPTMYAMSMF